jgi:phosphatidylglycerophosphate synthase
MSGTPFRTKLQHGIYRVIDPFVRLLIKCGLTPNAVTTIGFLLNICVTVIFILGAEAGHRGDLSYVGWAGALILFAGLFDMLDGQVARLGNMSSSFGALYDSVLDRYSEMVMFFGICYYLVGHHYFFSSIFAFIALIGSMMVSYTRARAEGLGIECKDGLMQRPERVVLIGLSAIACGITAHYIGGDHKWYVKGVKFHVLETMSIFTLPIVVMAALTNITAVKRLLSARKTLNMRDAGKDISKKALIGISLAVLTGMGFTGKESGETKKIPAEKAVVADPGDNFPVPSGNANQLFYLQRNANANTIVYELNYEAPGRLDADAPIHPFWIRYADGGAKKELNYIQRVFAYGVKVWPQDNDTYEFAFVSYKKQRFTLARSHKDGKYHVYAIINKKPAMLTRVFIQVEGGTFWSPNVVYMEKKGIDPDTGKEVMERFKP